MDETVATDALPRWAPRVSQEKVRRLCETDARGGYNWDTTGKGGG